MLSNTQNWVDRFVPSDACVTLLQKRCVLGRSGRKKNTGKCRSSEQRAHTPPAQQRPGRLSWLRAPGICPALPSQAWARTARVSCSGAVGALTILALSASAPHSFPHTHQPTPSTRTLRTAPPSCGDRQSSFSGVFTV